MNRRKEKKIVKKERAKIDKIYDDLRKEGLTDEQIAESTMVSYPMTKREQQKDSKVLGKIIKENRAKLTPEERKKWNDYAEHLRNQKNS